MSSSLHNNDNRFLLETRIHQLDFLQRAISFHQSNSEPINIHHLYGLQNVIFEIHIALIQYINRSDIQIRPNRQYLRNPPSSDFPPIECMPFMVLHLLRILYQDIENNEFEDMSNMLPIHITRLRQRLFEGGVHDEEILPIVKESKFPEKRILPLKKAELEASLPNPCGICLETHLKKESIECCCLHSFGKECFKGWLNTCKKNKQPITCPNCRNPLKSITHFGERVPQSPKTDMNSTWRDVI